MKKRSIMMLGVAAIASSAMFASSAFAKVDEDGAYVAPPAIFNVGAQTNQTQTSQTQAENVQQTPNADVSVSTPAGKDDKKF